MPNLEDKMNEFLSGKFFWEPTADLDDCRVPEIIELRRVQKKIAKPGRASSNLRSTKGDPSGIDSVKNVSYLTESVAKAHGCEASDLTGKSHEKRLSAPKQHYNWCLMRYYPTLSVSQLAKLIDRDHATVIKSAQRFELVMDKYVDQIRAVDKAMWID